MNEINEGIISIILILILILIRTQFWKIMKHVRLLLFLLFKICQGKEHFDTGHEVAIVELYQIFSTILHDGMDLLSSRGINFKANVILK